MTSPSTITFADVVHQSISFSKEKESQAIVLDLVDTSWFQRLRDVHQTANTRLLYMFSEHSRFGHCLGVAYMANQLMDSLEFSFGKQIAPYRNAVSAAALLHDIGHLAPGSHIAFRVWFPDIPDSHEEVAARIIGESSEIQSILSKYGPSTVGLVQKILHESADIPPWTWEIISGGGWNVDRGNWSIVDSVMAGVNYGKYNIPALTDAIVLTDDGHLALRENRLDAMMHFAMSRHAMYRQIYQHRVLLSADTINRAIVQRARDLGDKIGFQDPIMRAALKAKSPNDLSLNDIFEMRESWWRYHLHQWRKSEDKVLSDLSDRLLHRRLFKTVAIRGGDDATELKGRATTSLMKFGFDPKYYLHEISTADVHEGDYKKSMLVLTDDGQVKNLTDAEPLFHALVRESKAARKTWLAIPSEAKAELGRLR